MCVTSYENDSYCWQCRGSQSQARAAQNIDAGQSGHRARPALAGTSGLIADAIKHNGRSHVACPQAAAKALLVAPLHATPVMSCAHLPCACGLLLTACSNKPHAEAAIGVCGHGWCRHHRGSSQALRAVCRVGPAHPQGPGAYAPLARAGSGPSAPKGLPPARRWGVVALASVVLVLA